MLSGLRGARSGFGPGSARVRAVRAGHGLCSKVERVTLKDQMLC